MMKTRWKRLALATFSTLFALILSEIGLRFLSTERLGFVYEDGVFSRPIEFDRDRERNSLGFHDAEIEAIDGDRSRIVFLGDSYVHAAAVSVGETVGQRLEASLGEDWDVVSIGGTGWGQTEELEALHTHGESLAPDVVLTLFLPLNDVRNNHPDLQREATLQMARMQRFRPGWTELRAEDAPFFWFPESRLNQFLSHQFALRNWEDQEDEIPLDYEVYSTVVDPLWEDAWTRTEALILETRALARRLGADYAVAIATTPQTVLNPEAGVETLVRAYPGMADRQWDLERPSERLVAFCEAEGIPVANLEGPLRERTASGERLHFPYDGHWNTAGHRVAGDRLSEFVRTNFVP